MFTRSGGDGRAAFSSLCYEYLMMVALQGLAIMATLPVALLMSSSCPSDHVVRDQYYTNDYTLFHGGVLMREPFSLSSPLLRLGTITSIADAALVAPIIFPSACGGKDVDNSTLAFCLVTNVVDSTAIAAASWQSVGFVHSALNSDNISLMGEAIDLNVASFLSTYDLSYSSSFLDSTANNEEKMYSFGKQPSVLILRLEKFAKDLSVDINVADQFGPTFIRSFHNLMNVRLGLRRKSVEVDEPRSHFHPHPCYGNKKECNEARRKNRPNKTN